MSEPSPTPAAEIREAPEALDPNFRIELPNFEGPLDLLLHLIRKHELDILDLPIAFITDKYLEYLGLMGALNLDIASEYLVMAATLAHIKSKMLLPRPPQDQDDDEIDELDPRAELIRRLLEYQKYKTVAADLGERAIVGRDVFSAGTPPPASQEAPPLAQVSVFKLLDALKRIAERVNATISLEVDAERMSIQERIGSLVDLLRERRRCRFDELFEGVSTSYDLVVTFLALLEMAKMRLASIYQTDHEEPIYLEYTLLDASGEAVIPADLARPSSDGIEAPIDAELPKDSGARRESVVVPAGTSDAYAWSEDELEP
ncbi:MAG: segregation/condensation protein A [Deltaproteobacteria bacterium]|nr:segregation/condensation protein A [Deltaproteobacteria bacterium]MBT8483136.1 segregation/condensation protein A [Deltaproteobacteria bacterium]NND30303.1 segregation/condensation protein A [Myxococcales bacterium]NNL25995.1 segregation/condensation protein A [Myxococcales bacterium]